MVNQRRFNVPTMLTVVAAGLVLVACGSAGRSNSSLGGQTAPVDQTDQAMMPFVHCMRSHGVPSFPDPGSRTFKNAFDTQAPVFKSAYTHCQHLQPGGGPPNQNQAHSHAQITALLAFAHCLHIHGFANFPDPNSTGQITHQMVANAGINLHQPAVLLVGDTPALRSRRASHSLRKGTSYARIALMPAG